MTDFARKFEKMFRKNFKPETLDLDYWVGAPKVDSQDNSGDDANILNYFNDRINQSVDNTSPKQNPTLGCQYSMASTENPKYHYYAKSNGVWDYNSAKNIKKPITEFFDECITNIRRMSPHPERASAGGARNSIPKSPPFKKVTYLPYPTTET
jgi:hypothetical protein